MKYLIDWTKTIIKINYIEYRLIDCYLYYIQKNITLHKEKFPRNIYVCFAKKELSLSPG